MKMTWLHKEFVLIFSPADGQELWHLCRTKCLLTLASLAETIKDPYVVLMPSPYYERLRIFSINKITALKFQLVCYLVIG